MAKTPPAKPGKTAMKKPGASTRSMGTTAENTKPMPAKSATSKAKAGGANAPGKTKATATGPGNRTTRTTAKPAAGTRSGKVKAAG